MCLCSYKRVDQLDILSESYPRPDITPDENVGRQFSKDRFGDPTVHKSTRAYLCMYHCMVAIIRCDEPLQGPPAAFIVL